MTLDEAYGLQRQLAEVEFPTVFSGSVFFALFKTYGIPSISKLLVATGQLASETTASKRAADTGVILTEVVLHHPTNPRAVDGIARMNYLHNRYRKAGKISDEDILYTLSLFVLEPIRWTSRLEWRDVSEVERCAMGVYWRWMGEAMEIPTTPLPSAKSGWKDGLHFLDELEDWSRQYEARHMIPASSNEIVAKGTINIALTNVPKFLHGFATDMVNALLEPRLRTAMKFPDPSTQAALLLRVVMTTRQLLVRHLFLPRPYFMRKKWFTDELTAEGNIHSVQFVAHPWYVKPTQSWRWSLKGLLLRLAGGKVPGDDGNKYQPQGYKIAELGPETLVGKGHEEMDAERERIGKNQRIGCPFSRW